MEQSRKLTPREIERAAEREKYWDAIEKFISDNPNLSYTKCAEAIGVSLVTVQRVVNARGLNRRNKIVGKEAE
jgi:hypothetical protein